MEYLFILMNQDLNNPVYSDSTLVTALANTKENALQIMKQVYGDDVVSGPNILARIIKANLTYVLPKIVCEDEQFGYMTVHEVTKSGYNNKWASYHKDDTDYLDDPDQ